MMVSAIAPTCSRTEHANAASVLNGSLIWNKFVPPFYISFMDCAFMVSLLCA